MTGKMKCKSKQLSLYSGLQICDFVIFDEWLPTVRKILVPSKIREWITQRHSITPQKLCFRNFTTVRNWGCIFATIPCDRNTIIKARNYRYSQFCNSFVF